MRGKQIGYAFSAVPGRDGFEDVTFVLCIQIQGPTRSGFVPISAALEILYRPRYTFRLSVYALSLEEYRLCWEWP